MVILPLKVLKLSNRGSQDISSPLAFAEGLFIFINLLKEGFLKDLSYNEYKNINFIGGLKDILLEKL
jgi:hypothetical protein